jgi:hypothetical protein
MPQFTALVLQECSGLLPVFDEKLLETHFHPKITPISPKKLGRFPKTAFRYQLESKPQT